MTLLTDPVGKRDPLWERGQASASRWRTTAPARREEPRIAPPPSQGDAEVQELVQKFENRYAELAPQPDEPAPQPSPFDDLFDDVPDEMGAQPRQGTRTRPTPRAVKLETSAPPAVQPASAQADARNDDLSLDDALALLRAGERKAATSDTTRNTLDPDEDDDRSIAPKRTAVAPRSRDVEVKPLEAPAPTQGRSRRHRRMLARICAVGAIALALGAGIGYIAAQKRDVARAAAEAQTSAQGTAGLRIDYSLRKR